MHKGYFRKSVHWTLLWGVPICMETVRNKTAFDVNLAVVRYAGLTLSSKLLKPACKVYD